MSMPPPPPDDQRPPAWQPYGQYPYGQYPYYPPPPPSSSGTVIAMATLGATLFVLIDLVVFWVVLLSTLEGRMNGPAAIAAVSMALLAFGGGGLLLALRKPWAKGMGIGLMCGWALLTIFSAGICTGAGPWLWM